MLSFYGYKKCGTSKKGENYLESIKQEYNFIDITLNPPSKEELKKIIENSGEDIKKFFNTSGLVYKSENMKEKIKTMTKEEQIEALSQNGKLLKRPIVTDNKKVTVGFKEEIFAKTWGKL